MLRVLVCSLLLSFVFTAAAEERGAIFKANERLGRGVNLGNFLEAPRGANWGVTIEDRHFDIIKEAGFDTVRLPVRWNDYAATESPYTIESDFFARIDHLLDQAERVGLNVVLNIHHYDGLDDAPAEHRERFAALWRQIARRYRERPESLYFELDNEPHDALIEVWNDVLKEGLAAVRESNPTRPVVVGPPSYNAIWALPKLELPDDPNLIVTVHMYNPFPFTHQGASWANEEVQQIKNRPWGRDAEYAALNKEIAEAAAWGKEHNRPIFLGEFGAYGAAPMESRVKWTAAVRKAAESHGMSWAYWEFAAGFGLYDPVAKKWREPLLNALIPAGQ